jgi:hypothetical protein
MPFGCLQRLAPFATAFFFLAAATDFRSPVQADDRAPAQSPHEAAVLDRIFANWKARQDRVHSLHFTMDFRSTYRKGSWDLSSNPRTRFERDQAFDIFGVQLWMDGDDRMCLSVTPSFRAPAAKLIDRRRVVFRSVMVGKTTSMFFAGPLGDASPPQRAAGPYGLISRSPIVNRPSSRDGFEALYFTFRAQPPWIDWRKEQFHLVDENANIDNGHYVKFERERRGVTQETYWVSPARDDVVVHWTIKNPPLRTWDGSIKYQKDATYGWIPSEWRCEFIGALVEEYKVTGYAINEKLDPAVFSQEFPAGTPVDDASNATSPATTRLYVVQQDGSKRTISRAEFNRLAGVPEPPNPKRQVPAKPQGK